MFTPLFDVFLFVLAVLLIFSAYYVGKEDGVLIGEKSWRERCRRVFLSLAPEELLEFQKRVKKFESRSSGKVEGSGGRREGK